MKQLDEKIYEFLHKQPYGTDELVNIHRIIIPKEFMLRESRPSKIKMITCRQNYHRLGYLDKPIEVKRVTNKENSRLLLLDKYTRLCVAFEMGIKNIPVKYIEDNYKQDIYNI